MDRLDKGLYALGEAHFAQTRAGTEGATLANLLESAACRGVQRREKRRRRALLAAALCCGLLAGLLVGKWDTLTALRLDHAGMGGGIPMTDGPAEGEAAPAVREAEAQWENVDSPDLPLQNAPVCARMEVLHFGYIPAGMTLRHAEADGYVEIADGDGSRSVFGSFCLRYALSPEEYEGLAVQHARVRLRRDEAGNEGENITWILRLNEDVYFYLHMYGLDYETSLALVRGIQNEA